MPVAIRKKKIFSIAIWSRLNLIVFYKFDNLIELGFQTKNLNNMKNNNQNNNDPMGFNSKQTENKVNVETNSILQKLSIEYDSCRPFLQYLKL